MKTKNSEKYSIKIWLPYFTQLACSESDLQYTVDSNTDSQLTVYYQLPVYANMLTWFRLNYLDLCHLINMTITKMHEKK